MNVLTKIVGGISVVAFFFFGTLFLLDHFDSSSNDPKSRDALRSSHAEALKKALESYRSAFRKYPTFPDNLVDDLAPALVGGGFLREIPQDPSGRATQYRYASLTDGTAYGLLFHLEVAKGKIPAGGQCLTGVGIQGKDWYGAPPSCPF